MFGSTRFSRSLLQSSGNRLASSSPRCSYQDMLLKNITNVPRLPIPALEDTMERYLTSIRPLVSKNEFMDHEKLVQEFQGGRGPDMHKKLIAMDDHEGYPYSYIEKHWDDMYLAGRWVAPVNSNPFYILKSDGDTDQTSRAARYTVSSLKWWLGLLRDGLEPDPRPVCMFQYAYQFGTARIARHTCDELELYPHSKHIVVLCRNKFFKVDVVQPGGSLISVEGLRKALQRVQHEAATGPEEPHCLGILTGDERDAWAQARSDVVADPGAASALKDLDSSLMVLVLDEEDVSIDETSSSSSSSSSSEAAARALQRRSDLFLRGAVPGRNRWFDKMQVIVTADGTLGMNFEHSYSDGTAWNRVISEAWSDMQGLAPPEGCSAMPAFKHHDACESKELVALSPTRLPASVRDRMGVASEEFAGLCEDTAQHVLLFNEFGKATIKDWRLGSPDAVVQMAMQLAYHRLHKTHTGGLLPPTYESCAVRNFRHGRTETIRSACPEALEFVTAMDSSRSSSERLQLLGAAATAQSGLAKAASGGLGVDRHLLALKKIAESETASDPSKPLPGLFSSPTFSHSSSWVLSTSNVTQGWNALFGFGPVVGDGYGLGYQIHDDSIPINLSSSRRSEVTNGADMRDAIAGALRDIKSLQEEGK